MPQPSMAAVSLRGMPTRWNSTAAAPAACPACSAGARQTPRQRRTTDCSEVVENSMGSM